VSRLDEQPDFRVEQARILATLEFYERLEERRERQEFIKAALARRI
jgi:hypothetical protein